MDKKDVPFLSASELSRLIECKEVSPVEATEAYLDRIQEVDAKLNSYVTVCRDEALQAAREAEQAISRGNYLGPLHGVPVAVKDQFYTKGIRTTAGYQERKQKRAQGLEGKTQRIDAVKESHNGTPGILCERIRDRPRCVSRELRDER